MESNPGPVDASVLYEQERHVSSAVWDGQERGALRCHEHTSKLGEWRLIPRQLELVEKAGFGCLRRIPAISLDNPLISALVERWRRETNTFHFTVGEMTVTLQDVALLLGLAIDGKPVIGVTHTTCASVCLRLLGKAPDSNYASGGMVKLSWLKEFFSQLREDAPDDEAEQCTRAYLLYLVGSTIFSTTTGNKVPVMYLPLFEDFEESGRYAWGAAALAFLYRALGNACVKTQSTICGCLTLLQCWSYFHLNIGRPKLNHDLVHDQFPFVLRWKGKQSGPTTNRDVVFYRKALDLLKPIDVEWLPYKYMDSTIIPEEIRKTLIFGRVKTMLICFDKAERHLPDRCLRQYGLSQSIPEDVEKWLRKSRGVDGGVDLSAKMESELNEWSERHLHIVDGDDDGDEGEYMEWYLKITRKVVGRPISLSSEFQRTISGLKEIAYLADSFSTKGLDGQQFESISRIRFIAQDCLRDQTTSPATPPPLPAVELGKRTRGKEKVRKKGGGKRKRRDDPMEYQEASDDDQLPPFGVVIEVDQLQLRQVDGEVGQLQLHHASNEVDHRQLSHIAGKGDKVVQEHKVSKVDDVLPSTPTNDVDVSQPPEVMEDIIHSVPNETSVKNIDFHSSEGIKRIDNSQDSFVIDEVKDSQMCDVTTELDDSQPHNDPNDLQLCQETIDDVQDVHLCDTGNKVDDPHVSDASSMKDDDSHLSGATIREVDETKLHHSTKEVSDPHGLGASEEVNGSQLLDSTEEANDSNVTDSEKKVQDSQLKTVDDLYLRGATANEVDEDFHRSTKEVNGAHVLNASKKVNDSQLPDSTEEANNSIVTDSEKEVQILPLPDAAKKMNDSQSANATEEVSNVQIPDATEAPNNLPLPDSSNEVKDLHPHAINDENDSHLPDRKHVGNGPQYPDESQVANDLQLSGKPNDGNNLPVPDKTKEEDDLLNSDATKELCVIKDSQLPCEFTAASDLDPPDTTNEVNDTSSIRRYTKSSIRNRRNPPQSEVATEDGSGSSSEIAKDDEK